MSERARARSLGNQMGPQYMPLSNLEESRSTTRGPTYNNYSSRLSQLPRKWVATSIAVTICLLLAWVNYHPKSSVGKGSLPPTNLPAIAAPLLGEVEDASKLWYPSSKGGPEFQPPVTSHAFHVDPANRPRTPLFIGFTRNNDMLIQTVLSYIAAGWPPMDIIVVDNSGTMDANSRGLLSPSNPFYLNYAVIRDRYGVSILQTPTLFSFAQLQNFFLRTAIAHNWPFYFWSHMDIAVLSDETTTPYNTFYSRILQILSDHGINGPDHTTYSIANNWALRYFTYDWLTLINVEAWRTIGSWDVFIPYYTADCDAYSRIAMHNIEQSDVRAGLIYDLASVLPDPETSFFPQTPSEPLNSERYQTLRKNLEDMMAAKKMGHRNEWQAGKGDGGKGEPWTYDPKGFQKLWWDTAEFGRTVYKKKWGKTECRLADAGVSLNDEFRNLQ